MSLKERGPFLGQTLIKVVLDQVKWIVKSVLKFNLIPLPHSKIGMDNYNVRLLHCMGFCIISFLC